ncbi:MAG: hypothetical protein AAGI46_07895 [Planctomycetota bacterium]
MDRTPVDPFNSPARWARRLAFPLAATAIVLAIKALQTEGIAWPWWLAATAAAAGGVVMLRIARRE